MLEVTDKEYVFVVNTRLHETANVKKRQFIDRAHIVETLAASPDIILDFLPSDAKEWGKFSQIHQMINVGNFDLLSFPDSNRRCVVAVPQNIFKWLETTPINIVEQQILYWVTGHYLFNPKDRQELNASLYPLLLNKVKYLIDQYGFASLLEEDSFKEKSIAVIYQGLQIKSKIVFSKLFAHPLKLFFSEDERHWRNEDKFSVVCTSGHLHKEDWQRLRYLKTDNNNVYNDSEDIVECKENSKELAWYWKHTLAFNGGHVYNFCRTENNPRQDPTSETRTIVWNRDKGACVTCGSRTLLEYDHIIPADKGGNAEPGNIQIRCKKCNSKKSNKIM